MIFQDESKYKKVKTHSGKIGDLVFSGAALKNMLSSVHLDVKSNREVIVEGCNTIEEYDENIVKIKTPKMGISFFGRNLEIKCMSVDSLVVEGVISSIEFGEE